MTKNISSTRRIDSVSSLVSSFLNNPTTVPAVLERLKTACGVASDGDLGSALGISPQAISKARSKGRIPADWCLTIGLATGVRLPWLVQGEEPMRKAVEDGQSAQSANNALGSRLDLVPVVALNSGPTPEWCGVSETSLNSLAPPDIANSEGAFAVIAFGDSMAPAGIEQGFLCFCDPSLTPKVGDAVFCEDAQGLATIRLYLGEAKGKKKGELVKLRGWGPYNDANTDDPQQPSMMEIEKAALKRVVPVVYVKRRL